MLHIYKLYPKTTILLTNYYELYSTRIKKKKNRTSIKITYLVKLQCVHVVWTVTSFKTIVAFIDNNHKYE